jgi:hypothetical protein
MSDDQSNGERKITVPEGLFSNTAAIVSEVLKSPLTTTLIFTGPGYDVDKPTYTRDHARPPTSQRQVPKRLKLESPFSLAWERSFWPAFGPFQPPINNLPSRL